VINPAEAEVVRQIFRRYLELGCVRLLKEELDRRGVVSKSRSSANGPRQKGYSFSRGALYVVLSNPLYIGEVRHRGVRHPGQHQPIIDRDLLGQGPTAAPRACAAAPIAHREGRTQSAGRQAVRLLRHGPDSEPCAQGRAPLPLLHLAGTEYRPRAPGPRRLAVARPRARTDRSGSRSGSKGLSPALCGVDPRPPIQTEKSRIRGE
jgi:hypothetical protein